MSSGHWDTKQASKKEANKKRTIREEERPREEDKGRVGDVHSQRKQSTDSIWKALILPDYSVNK